MQSRKDTPDPDRGFVTPDFVAAGEVECPNCDARSSGAGKFCPHCGQALRVEKLTFRRLLSDAAGQLTETDRGFWFTLKSLLLRPGTAVREYLGGKRKLYTKPLQFYVVMLAFFVGLTELLQLDTIGIRHQITSQTGLSLLSRIFLTLLDPSGEEASRRVLALFHQNIKISYSLLVLAMGVALWAGFWKRGFTLVEMMVLSLYLTGFKYLFELAALLVMVTPLALESRLTIGSMLMLLSNGYLLWGIARFSGKISIRSVGTAFLLLLMTGIMLNLMGILIKTF